MTMNWIKVSLQTRVVLLVLGVVTTLWIAATITTWFDAQHELDELLDGHLAQAATLLIAQSSLDEDEHAYVEPEREHRYASRVAFQMWHEGRLRWRSGNAPLEPMTSRNKGFDTQTINGEAWRVYATRGAKDDVQLFVGERVDARNEILYAVLRGILMPLAVGLPLLALAGWWAVRSGLRPLLALEDLLRKRSPDALGPVNMPDAPREIGTLVNALNNLFVRIAEMLENERRFTQDAAHELRTPIAAIRSQAQVALGATSNDERSHALHSTLVGCDRAARLVDQLLLLARLEARNDVQSPPPTLIDLSAIARAVVADLAPEASKKMQHLAFDAPDTCMAFGDAALVSALIRNLVDNAIRYSPNGANVNVQIEHGNSVRLVVEDSGLGLAPELRQRLGERFFRVLGSGEDGSGLGWSIVRRIARVLDLNISVDQSATLGGLSVTIRWPAEKHRPAPWPRESDE